MYKPILVKIALYANCILCMLRYYVFYAMHVKMSTPCHYFMTNENKLWLDLTMGFDYQPYQQAFSLLDELIALHTLRLW